MKKLLTAAALVAAFFMPVCAAQPFPSTVRLPSLCFDKGMEEALMFHATQLGQLPIMKLDQDETLRLGNAVLVVNPSHLAWSILFYRTTEAEIDVVCAIASGKNWEILKPPSKEKTLL